MHTFYNYGGGIDVEYILEVNNIIKKVNNFELGTINFKLEPGYIMGLIGPNGAGKTTLIQTILGLYQKQEGDIRICDYDLEQEAGKAKDHMGFILDEELFLEYLSAEENAKMYGKYYSKWDPILFDKLCKRFEVDRKKPLKKLSKGNKTKFQLAFALSHGADLFVFDEPAAGLDPVFRKELMEIMCDLIFEGDKSILFSTHLTDELDKIADYITFLYNGKQIFSLSKEEMSERYRLVKGTKQQLANIKDSQIIGRKIYDSYVEALVKNENLESSELIISRPNIEDIMYYTENGTI
jgi:ABC-2 type transport system ATP-binding protein